MAKAKFSEVIREASTDGPQQITVHGEAVAVIISFELYNKMRARKPSFVDFMLQSPLAGLEEIEFERNPSLNREDDL